MNKTTMVVTGRGECLYLEAVGEKLYCYRVFKGKQICVRVVGLACDMDVIANELRSI